jgi:thiamine-monophosphate kinase
MPSLPHAPIPGTAEGVNTPPVRDVDRGVGAARKEGSGDADTLGGIGESAVLARIFPRLPTAASALLGPGDDSAVIAAPDGRFVVTTDMMIHGPDFRLAWSTPHDLGWKAAASNLSDVAAMGAVPSALVVAIAAPADSPVSLLEGIADGLRDACDSLAPGCGVVGGDLSVSATLTIAVTAFGDLEGRPPVLRSGASVGDVVAVAGVLGEAAASLLILFSEAVDADGRPDARLADALRSRTAPQLSPSPPIAAGRVAALAGATAMLDLSDGLAIDSARLAGASGVGIDFDSGSLGANPAMALGGGEDHSLLATFPPEAPLPAGFRQIGVCVTGSGLFVDGHPHDSSGWDPYRDWAGLLG